MDAVLFGNRSPSFKFRKFNLKLSYTQAVLIGAGLGLGVAALKVFAAAGLFCTI